jgi:hypothetical protein
MLSSATLDFLSYLIAENKDFVKDYNEEDLKINFIAPICGGYLEFCYLRKTG